MKKAVILGAGTAGTMMSNHLAKKLPKDEWEIVVVDQEKTHYYQPGFLFLPFDLYQPEDVVKPIDDFLPSRAKRIVQKIDRVEPESNTVTLQNGDVIGYDILIIATGSHIAPEEVTGMMSDAWHKDVFDFYTYGLK